MNRVGHAFFKRRMRETNAIFGGEVTGHYYFRDNFYADNGFIPALLILELMSKKGQSLHELLRAAARAVLHLRRDQHQAGEHGRRCRRSWRQIAAKYADAPSVHAGRHLGRVSRLALQRAAVEHRAAAAAESRSEDAGADGSRSGTRWSRSFGRERHSTCCVLIAHAEVPIFECRLPMADR